MQGLTFCCLTVARSGPLVGGSTQAWHDRNLVERVAVALVVGVMLDAVRCGTEDVGATPRRDLLAVLLAAADVLRGGHIDRFALLRPTHTKPGGGHWRSAPVGW